MSVKSMLDRERLAKKATKLQRVLRRKFACRNDGCKRMSYPKDMWLVGGQPFCSACEKAAPPNLSRKRVYEAPDTTGDDALVRQGETSSTSADGLATSGGNS